VPSTPTTCSVMWGGMAKAHPTHAPHVFTDGMPPIVRDTSTSGLANGQLGLGMFETKGLPQVALGLCPMVFQRNVTDLVKKSNQDLDPLRGPSLGCLDASIGDGRRVVRR
jgi:hypothetical protein